MKYSKRIHKEENRFEETVQKVQRQKDLEI